MKSHHSLKQGSGQAPGSCVGFVAAQAERVTLDGGAVTSKKTDSSQLEPDDEVARKVRLKEPAQSRTPAGGSPLLDQQPPEEPFAGVNRKPRVQLLVHRVIDPKDWNHCDGCEHLEKGNARCGLFDMILGNDHSLPCGEGWYRTTQCKEAELESVLYMENTTAFQRGAARTRATYGWPDDNCRHGKKPNDCWMCTSGRERHG